MQDCAVIAVPPAALLEAVNPWFPPWVDAIRFVAADRTMRAMAVRSSRGLRAPRVFVATARATTSRPACLPWPRRTLAPAMARRAAATSDRSTSCALWKQPALARDSDQGIQPGRFGRGRLTSLRREREI